MYIYVSYTLLNNIFTNLDRISGSIACVSVVFSLFVYVDHSEAYKPMQQLQIS
jgi:hypothetical protein